MINAHQRLSTIDPEILSGIYYFKYALQDLSQQNAK